MNSVVLTVHQLNDYLRVLLTRDPLLQKVRVRGEISNLKVHSSGHMYFSLKDEHGRIQCIMFRQRRESISLLPSNGMQVIVTGNVSVYTRDGQYQLYADEIKQDGLGDLHLAFEELKRKLREEGLFDATYKKLLPLLPRKIAVITSHTGAAVKDIIRVIKDRNPNVDVLIVPVAVQGSGAAEQITKAIDYVNTRDDIDLIITGRGGGSIEELWAFNEEIVARAIFRSDIPVIAAIGHETDFTIADFTADVRAATPSNGAEIAVPEASHMLALVDGFYKSLSDAIIIYLNKKKHRLELLENHYALQTPRALINQHTQYLDQLIQRLINGMQSITQRKNNKLSKAVATLEAFSPLKVLLRGYTIATTEDDMRPIRSISELSPAQRLNLIFSDGQAVCQIEEINTMKREFENYLDEGEPDVWRK